MSSKRILIELIEELDNFENQGLGGKDIQLSDFLAYLNNKNEGLEFKGREIGGGENPEFTQAGETVDTEIARLLVILYRYAKGHLKKLTRESIIQTPEELSFLLVLMSFPSLTKTELIIKNVMEKTSGIEVIKRLLKKDLVIQFNDPNDKRSQQVKITEMGKHELFKLLPSMQGVSTLISGNLSDSEKSNLRYLLKKLDLFHHEIYVSDK